MVKARPPLKLYLIVHVMSDAVEPLLVAAMTAPAGGAAALVGPKFHCTGLPVGSSAHEPPTTSEIATSYAVTSMFEASDDIVISNGKIG
jgi:hypothetical protein